MSQRLAQVGRCRFVFIEEIKNILNQDVESQTLHSFTERLVIDGVYAFEIFLQTGQRYEIYIAIDPMLKKTEFINISSKLDTISIGTIHYVDLIPIMGKVKEYLGMRFRGYRLEKKVIDYLVGFVKNNPNGYIQSVRKATDEEDKRHKDIVLVCCMRGRIFFVSFDLKNNKKAIEEAREAKKHTPSLYTNETELKKRPQVFDEKILYLITTQYNRLFLNIVTPPEKLHVM